MQAATAAAAYSADALPGYNLQFWEIFKMIRLFDEHSVRIHREIVGLWDLFVLDNDGERDAGRKAAVPACVESMEGLYDFRGRVVYKKTVATGKKNIRLVFKGVSHTADIYWDGKHIAHHYNAYTQFDVCVCNVQPGEHTLEVYADSSFSDYSSLHVHNDYRSYGGITRPVVIEELNDAYIRYLHMSTVPNGTAWNLNIKAYIKSLSDKPENFKLCCTIAGRTIEFEGAIAGVGVDGECVLERTVEMDSVCEWSMENPQMYTLYAVLYNESGDVIDDLADRVGFREVRVEGSEILLNGRPIYVKGYNRHEDYGQLGCAVPTEIMAYDLDIILSTGANLVRTCHYPNDERFLDMCDERGVLVWEEGHARGLSEERMRNENFKKQSADCLDEMVNNHYNHPSIIMWGILNECASDTEYGRECYALQYAQMRALDSTRPLTTATCRHYNDICLDMPDIIAYNIYPQWYHDQDPVEYLDKLQSWVETTGGKGKPFIVSEIGAGGVYGYRTFTGVKWSEDRQSEILRETFEKYKQLDYLRGIIIWQFCDCRVDDEDWAWRPKTQNNKGIVDIYRQPKMAYYAAKQGFESIDSYI